MVAQRVGTRTEESSCEVPETCPYGHESSLCAHTCRFQTWTGVFSDRSSKLWREAITQATRAAGVSILGATALLLLAACGSASGTSGTSTAIPTATSASQADSIATDTLSFYGVVKQVSPTSITVSTPDGRDLEMHVVAGQTDLSRCNTALPRAGLQVEAHARAHQDGTYTAASLAYPDMADHHDVSQIEYHGVTISAVGADGVLHLRVGATKYAFPFDPTTDFGAFNRSAQAIGANQLLDVHVCSVGTIGTVVEVDRWNGN